MITHENIQDWIKTEEAFDMLLSLDSHLGHGRLLSKSDVEKLISLFPQFQYEAKGYRLIHSEDISRLHWNDDLNNISWSKNTEFISSFLLEYEKILKKDELFYKLYSANIRGFDVCQFALFLKNNSVAKDISSILLTHKYESEVLVCEFSNLTYEKSNF